MYLYFEEHSQFLSRLDEKKIPHGDRIIMVCASENDPRIVLHKPSLTIIESPDYPFTDELFTYPNRDSYTGIRIETMMHNYPLREEGYQIIRALFRFGNRDDLRFCQTAMAIQHKGRWLIDSPLDDIDGLGQAIRHPEARTKTIHLDIFVPQSLDRLDRLIDINSMEHLVNFRDGLRLKGLDREVLRGIEQE